MIKRRKRGEKGKQKEITGERKVNRNELVTTYNP